jgi:hypothetical protein
MDMDVDTDMERDRDTDMTWTRTVPGSSDIGKDLNIDIVSSPISE